MTALRIIDTGERPARWNVAATAALTELHADGRLEDTLRFHRYPASVLVGRHQRLDHAIRIDACKAAGIEIARRVSGGGSVYMASGALAWDLIVSRRRLRRSVGDVARIVGDAIASGIARLGVAARYCAENQIAVEGRKLCGMSGYYEGETIACQGTILIDADLRDIGHYLRMPFPSADTGQALTVQLTALVEWLGRRAGPREIQAAIGDSLAQALSCDPVHGSMTREAKALADERYRETFGRDEFVFADAFDTADAIVTGTQPLLARSRMP